MTTAKLFNNGRSQAVRLPKEYRFDSDEVRIAKIDDMVMLFPANKGWDLLAKSLERFTADFMDERVQGKTQDRAKL